MTRLAFIADVHLDNFKAHGGVLDAGLNVRAKLVLNALRSAFKLADDQQCEFVVVCGDLFNDVHPLPQLIAAVQEVLWSAEKNVYLLVGNHERVSVKPGDHALGPLAMEGGSGYVRIVEKPESVACGDADVWMVPHLPGHGAGLLASATAALGGAASEAAQGLASPRRRLLALHYGIADDDTPSFLKDAPDAVPVHLLASICGEHHLTGVFAGNWHQQKVWTVGGGPGGQECSIVQIGALAPRGWNDEGITGYGGLAVYDTHDDAITLHEVPGPRFVYAHTSDDLSTKWKGSSYATRLFVRRLTQPGESVEDITDDPTLVIEVLPDTAEAEAATRKAAGAARSVETLDEALAAYVQEMGLPAGVDRGKVLELSRQFLRRG